MMCLLRAKFSFEGHLREVASHAYQKLNFLKHASRLFGERDQHLQCLRSIQTKQLRSVVHCSQTLPLWHLESNSRCAPYPTLLATHATAWNSAPWRLCPLFYGAKLHRLDGPLDFLPRRTSCLGVVLPYLEIENLW